ncbi:MULTISPECIES: hypothetical protein [unclassified Pseudomonas]|uniref:hypothetical protein n=1 Tax=unclassified Pseudomonas TaxID=196821 RepID=UPI002E80A499|nr:hypothetical protein [Pseudomonas sp. 10C3]MEE3505327.1 hypothetical protein [Pseudomonas sp. 10C3]
MHNTTPESAKNRTFGASAARILCKAARNSDNWYWLIAFTKLNICHIIGAKELAKVGHDADLFDIQVEHLPKKAVTT